MPQSTLLIRVPFRLNSTFPSDTVSSFPLILRIGFGTKAVGWDNLVYGVLLVVFIILLPKGILGSMTEKLRARRNVGTGKLYLLSLEPDNPACKTELGSARSLP